LLENRPPSTKLSQKVNWQAHVFVIIIIRAHLSPKGVPALERGPPIVAVVEDDLSMGRSIQRLLAAHGFAVEIFLSAEAFLDSSRSEHLGCLVLDIQLPGMSGLELCARMIESRSSPPTVFITGFDDEDFEAAAARLGCVACLRKPFPPALLVSVVNAALSHPAG
jgi:FixJ family two-component response regulator